MASDGKSVTLFMGGIDRRYMNKRFISQAIKKGLGASIDVVQDVAFPPNKKGQYINLHVDVEMQTH